MTPVLLAVNLPCPFLTFPGSVCTRLSREWNSIFDKDWCCCCQPSSPYLTFRFSLYCLGREWSSIFEKDWVSIAACQPSLSIPHFLYCSLSSFPLHTSRSLVQSVLTWAVNGVQYLRKMTTVLQHVNLPSPYLTFPGSVCTRLSREWSSKFDKDWVSIAACQPSLSITHVPWFNLYSLGPNGVQNLRKMTPDLQHVNLPSPYLTLPGSICTRLGHEWSSIFEKGDSSVAGCQPSLFMPHVAWFSLYSFEP
ncbi:hypothetical protein J6590_081860 [Homalodisca vitripennis]|nr:hypothetical protein J6590_081860 [Homalodisca vitripennis]